MDELAENPSLGCGLGVVFIAVMAWVSYRGIVISERIQAVLVSFQFAGAHRDECHSLPGLSTARAGPTSSPDRGSPGSLRLGCRASEIAAGVILCIFIYWGWDSCLAITEETKDADKTPGRAAFSAPSSCCSPTCLGGGRHSGIRGLRGDGIGLAQRGEL